MKKKFKKADIIILIVLLFIVGLIVIVSISGTKMKAESLENFPDSMGEIISSDANVSAKKTTCADFDGKRAGITTGSIHDDIIKKNLPESEIYDFKNYSDLTAALTSDRIDYFLMTKEAIDPSGLPRKA